MTVYADYKLDMQPGRIMDTVCISQYEVAWRVLRFKLYYGGSAFSVPSDATAIISGRKADGHGFSYSMTVDAANSQVSVAVTEQMSAVSGPAICEVQVEADDEVIGSGNFVLMAEPSPLQGAVLSDSDMDAAEQCVALIGRAEAAAEAAEDAADRAEGTVTGTIDFNGRNGHVLPAASDYTAAMVDYGDDTVDDALDDLYTTVGTHTTDIASLDSLKAPKASPALTGSPTAPTVSTDTDESTKIATTKFVWNAINKFKSLFDSSLSSSSTNAVQNKVVKAALDGKAATGHSHAAATTSVGGFMTANDKTYVDQMRARVYSSYGPGSNKAAIGDNTQCVVFLKRGNYCMVSLTIKLEVQDSSVASNTTLIENLPKAYSIAPRFIISTPSGSSVATCYITSGGLLANSTALTASSTYYGHIVYVCNNANDWYDSL